MDKSLYGSESACEAQDLAPPRLFGLDLALAECEPPRHDPLPLIGLENLKAKPDARVVVLEERSDCSQEIAEILKNSAIVRLPDIEYIYEQRPAPDVDISQLDGRDVTLWFNPGLEGEIIADRFADYLTGRVARLTVIRWPEKFRREQFTAGELSYFFYDLAYDGDRRRSEQEFREVARREFGKLAADSIREGAF